MGRNNIGYKSMIRDTICLVPIYQNSDNQANNFKFS